MRIRSDRGEETEVGDRVPMVPECMEAMADRFGIYLPGRHCARCWVEFEIELAAGALAEVGVPVAAEATAVMVATVAMAARGIGDHPVDLGDRPTITAQQVRPARRAEAGVLVTLILLLSTTQRIRMVPIQ